MVSFSNTQDGNDDVYMVEYYEYEMEEDSKHNHPSSGDHPSILKTQEESSPLNVVETVSDDDDDDEYIEIEVTDDEDSTALPPLPPQKRNFNDNKNDASQPPAAASTWTSSTPTSTTTAATASPATISSTNVPRTTQTSATTTSTTATATTPPIQLTPSKKRVKDANSAGLSELSKQLRILQAKNESQAVDINRLERQLRILADLQGVNVADLRKALEDACASEAFGELQNRVAKLKYELEAATLAKQAELRKDTTAPHIANLELRVGELEEVEEKQRAEIRHLYEQLRFEREKSTRLEAENEQLKKEMEDMRRKLQQEMARASRLQAEYQEQMHKFQEGQARKMREELEQARGSLNSMESTAKSGAASNSTHAISPEMAAEYERMAKMLRERDEQLRIAQARLNAEEIKWAQKLKEVEEKARQTEMDLKVELDKLKLTLKEIEDAENQSGLRLAQYKARFTVQDERIEDLEQQLDSLYTAFNLLKEEFDSENVKRAAMLSNLNDADAEIARQANKLEKQKSQRGGSGFSSTPREMAEGQGSAFGSNESVQSVPRVIATPGTVPITPSTPSTRGYENHSMSSGRDGMEFEAPAYASASPLQPTPERTPSTWQLLFPQENQSSSFRSVQPIPGERLISGPLVVQSKGMLRKWKTKPSTIYLRGENYQWKIGEKMSFPLQFGISKVEYHPNHPLSFVVYLNPFDTMAPVIKAACMNERDYNRWMAALTKATTGEDFLGAATTPDTAADSSPYGIPNPDSMDDQEAAELQRILELSKHDI